MTRRSILHCTMLVIPFMLYMYFAIIFDLITNVPDHEENGITGDSFPTLKANFSNFERAGSVDFLVNNSTTYYCKEYESKCLNNIKFNCQNIKQIKLLEKIGHGVTKQAFLGLYKGEEVVVKMVTRHQKEARECLNRLLGSDSSDVVKRSKCFVFPTMKLMKEILMLHQLKHEGFLQLLGFCARSEESDSTDLSEHGVIAVYERGTILSVGKLKSLSTENKVRQSLHLVSFFQYLATSPLGSLRVRDFKMEHFLMVNSTIKMIDLDDVDNIEPSCDAYSIESNTQKPPCSYNLKCEMGLCNGHNAKRNIEKANELFFTNLLTPDAFPGECFKMLQHIHHSLRELSVNYGDLQRSLKELLDSVIYLH